MGEVYAAEDTKLQRRVAIKILNLDVARHEERLQRFEREAKAVAALDHPNIVTIYSLEEAPDEDGEPVHFITMQLVDGEPLSAVIPAEGMAVGRLFEIAVPLADAVSAAHAHGIVHRDLKPSNVMVSSDGRVRVLDFGLAKLREPSEAGEGASHSEMATGQTAFLTEEGMVLGTSAYMSPEQAEGKPIDHRSDIFSLGIVLYEMAAGQRPFQGDTKVSVISSIVKDTPALVSDLKPELPRHLGRIIKHCLEKNPERRFQSAKDLCNQLHELRGEILSGELDAPLTMGSEEWSTSVAETEPRPWPPATGQPPSADGPPVLEGRSSRHRTAAIAGGVILALLIALWALPSLRGFLGRALGPPVLPERKDVVVLEIDVPSGDPGTAALAAGLRDVMNRRLSRLTDDLPLDVLPPGRARRISSLERAGIEEGANLVIDGSIERSPSVTRLSLALRTVPDGAALRTAEVEVPQSDPLEVSERALVSAVEMLEFELPPAERRELLDFGTDVAAAAELYLRAVGQLAGETIEGVDAAIEALGQATVLDPAYAEAHATLGQAHWARYERLRDGQWSQRAMDACERAVSIDDRVVSGHLCLATIHEEAGRSDEAIAAHERAAYLEPTFDTAVFGLAEAYAGAGRAAEAEQTYRGFIELRSEYAAAYLELGVFYYFEGRIADAVEMFEQTVERAPGYRAGLSSLGGLYTLVGRYEDGVEMLERALALEPDGTAYNNLATTYFVLRRFGDAIDAYQEAIRFEPDNWLTWGNLGDAYYWAPGERDNAEAGYSHALELVEAHLQEEPRDADAISDRAKFLGMLGDSETALKELETAIQMSPRDPQVLYHGLLIHLRAGDHDRAFDYLERALEAGFSKPWVRDTPELDALRDSPRFRALLDER